MNVTCQYPGGCSAHPLHPTPYCSVHIDEMTRMVQRRTADIERVIEVQEAVIARPTLPLWRKPGLWLPWLVLAFVIGANVYYVTLGLWWFIFMPIAWFAWQFGTEGGKGS